MAESTRTAVTETTPLHQIPPHHDVDMWGCWNEPFLGGVGRVLTLIKNIYLIISKITKNNIFGFETLVFATSGILCMHNLLVTLQRESKT